VKWMCGVICTYAHFLEDGKAHSNNSFQIALIATSFVRHQAVTPLTSPE
jgi:hypothetical protein